MRKEIST